jgi:Transposase IS116/IS110/IS902 family
VTRFAGAKDPAKAVVAVAGIDPRAADSGQRAGYRRMSKRGSPYLRQAFYQAAFAAWQHDAMLGALETGKAAVAGEWGVTPREATGTSDPTGVAVREPESAKVAGRRRHQP